MREAVLAASLAARLPGSVALAWALLLRLWQTLIELLYVAGAVLVGRSEGSGEGAAAVVAPRAGETPVLTAVGEAQTPAPPAGETPAPAPAPAPTAAVGEEEPT